MKLIRATAFSLSLVLLGGGYVASQIEYRRDAYEEYAARVDTSAVRALAAGLFACCLVLPFIRKSPEDANS